MAELSERLRAVADFVDDGMVLADIGTDHGYIPIALVQEGRCPRAVAMDINAGPLARAREHIAAAGLLEQIGTRRSDGMKELAIGEADCAIVAGMGGALTIRILEESRAVAESMKELILQPQSELFKVRTYLAERGYEILDEDMVLEDGKFYPMMKVRPGNPYGLTCEEANYGKILLAQRHPVLKQFLQKELETKRKVFGELDGKTGEHIFRRRESLSKEILCVEELLKQWEDKTLVCDQKSRG